MKKIGIRQTTFLARWFQQRPRVAKGDYSCRCDDLPWFAGFACFCMFSLYARNMYQADVPLKYKRCNQSLELLGNDFDLIYLYTYIMLPNDFICMLFDVITDSDRCGFQYSQCERHELFLNSCRRGVSFLTKARSREVQEVERRESTKLPCLVIHERRSIVEKLFVQIVIAGMGCLCCREQGNGKTMDISWYST